MKRKTRNTIIKLLMLALFAFSVFGIVNVNATGYTYDHKGKVIYSTEGFTVNQTPFIYETLGIEAKTFTDANPTDLFVYKDSDMGEKDEAIGDSIVYLLDSGGTNKSSTLYVFNSDLKLKREIAYLRYNPQTLLDNSTILTKIKSGRKLVATSSAEAVNHTVTFVDSIDQSQIGTAQVVDGGTVKAILPPYHEGTYFKGWDKPLSEITEDVTISAIYEDLGETDTGFIHYLIKFEDGLNEDSLGMLDIPSGEYVIYPTAPVHDGYEFVGWDKDFNMIGGTEYNLTIKAQYTKVHTVKFVDGIDASTLAEVKVLDGKNATSPFPNNYDGKVFTGWSESLANIEEDKTVTSVYEDELDYFVVTYIDTITNEEIAKFNVRAGEDALLPSAPSHVGYQFSSWSGEVKNIQADVTIKAEYTKQDNGLTLDGLLAQDNMVLYMSGANSIYRGVARNSTPHTDYIYICDSGNNQILVIDGKSYEELPDDPSKGTYEIVQIITSPVSEIGSKTFTPLKVVNDAAGRVYVICEGIEDGILEFSKNGSFDRYVGTNYVTLSAWDIFIRNFATETQIDDMTQFQNTTFTSMVYKNNMIYATSYSIKNSNGGTNDKIMIKKINPSGKDVLRRNGYNIPKGDLTYTSYNDDNGAYGASQFVGISVNDYGVYTVVDTKRGRLFTYDNEGNLLYISGGTGTQLDKINIPVAVQYLGENVLVLDSKRKAIIIFEPTDIAKVINKAIECEYNGLSDQAYEYWEQVVQLNANYEFAYIGIGKHYMEATEIENNYRIAMDYFELGASQLYYSKAFKQYRDGIIKTWFPYVISGLLVIVIGGVVYRKVRRKKLGIKEEEMTGMGDE